MEAAEQQPPADRSREHPRSRKWLKILLGGLLAIVVILLGSWFVFFGRKIYSEPYQMALSKVRQDPETAERLGRPIRDVTWFPAGRITREGDRATARFNFTVSGPKGKAAVSTVAQRMEGQWGLTSLDVRFPDGTRHSVRTGSQDGTEAAPAWPPPGAAGANSEQPDKASSEDTTEPAPADINIDIPTLPEAP
jgi:hypothetical protein